MRSGKAALCEPNWVVLSGKILSGGYEVGGVIEVDADRARFRVSVLGDRRRNAYMDAFCAADPEGQEQLALWTGIGDLQDPALSGPLSAGLIEDEGAPLIYVIVPVPDEILADLLRERAATVKEAREILTSLCRALEYLHGHGWVHGHLSPEQVLATGDSVHISSEYAGRINTARPMRLIAPKYVAPEAIDDNLTPAADIWCLGATLFEALTRQKFSAGMVAEVPGLPEPFDTIVERCLDANPQTRCSLREIGHFAANGRIAAEAVAEPQPVTSAPTVQAHPKPVIVGRLARRRLPEETSRPKLWIYAAVAAVLVLLLLIWVIRPRHQYVTATAQVSPPQQATPQPGVAAAPVPAPPPKSKNPPLAINGAVWRVVVFTYSHKVDAEKKAHSVNQRHPNLGATVFSPSGRGSLYLVTVGGNMTREEAARLRQRVMRMGLPRDSYIQNYKQ